MTYYKSLSVKLKRDLLKIELINFSIRSKSSYLANCYSSILPH